MHRLLSHTAFFVLQYKYIYHFSLLDYKLIKDNVYVLYPLYPQCLAPSTVTYAQQQFNNYLLTCWQSTERSRILGHPCPSVSHLKFWHLNILTSLLPDACFMSKLVTSLKLECVCLSALESAWHRSALEAVPSKWEQYLLDLLGLGFAQQSSLSRGFLSSYSGFSAWHFSVSYTSVPKH